MNQLISIAVLLSYFVTIIFLFGLILTSLPHHGTPVPAWKILVFTGLACASLVHTWYYLLSFLAWSFAHYEERSFDIAAIWSYSNLLHTVYAPKAPLLEGIGAWLSNTRLFEQAWWAVCEGAANWWWSEQVCLYTAGAWTFFLATEGKQRGIKYLWAYMLLGQLVAISVASNLFYIAILLSQPNSRAMLAAPSFHHTVSVGTWGPIFLAVLTIAFVPFTTSSAHPYPHLFLPNLLVMHALLFIPLRGNQNPGTPTSSRSKKSSRYSLSLSTTFTVLYILSILVRGRTILTTWSILSQLTSKSNSLSGVIAQLNSTLYANPAQASIGWDALWITISFTMWVFLRPPMVRGEKESETSTVGRLVRAADVLLASLLVSVGVMAIPWLRPPESVGGNSKEEMMEKDQ